MTNFYEVLNCDVDASLEEIRKNYRELILKFHPDKQNVTDSYQFCIVQEAWNVLSNPRRRQLFDEELFVRNSEPILYGTFNLSDFDHDTESKKYCYICRCGGNYYLEEEELKLTRTFQTLHLPCENCSLIVRLTFNDTSYNGNIISYSFNKIQNCNCERKCFDRVPKDVQEKIYNGYNQLPNNNEKNLYLYGLICKTSDKGDQPNSRASYRYFVKVNGFQVDICQKAFINIHGITPAKVRTLLQKLNEGVIYPNDRRGEARRQHTTEISEANEQGIVNHIMSVVRIKEVWDRLRKGEKINVSRLWEDYKGYCSQSSDNDDDSQKEIPSQQNRLVSKSAYAIIFKRVYPEIIDQLDEKNELPSTSKTKRKTRKKSIPQKRKANKNSKTSQKLNKRTAGEEFAGQILEPDSENGFANENDEDDQSVSSPAVIYSLQPIQVVHLI